MRTSASGGVGLPARRKLPGHVLDGDGAGVEQQGNAAAALDPRPCLVERASMPSHHVARPHSLHASSRPPTPTRCRAGRADPRRWPRTNQPGPWRRPTDYRSRGNWPGYDQSPRPSCTPSSFPPAPHTPIPPRWGAGTPRPSRQTATPHTRPHRSSSRTPPDGRRPGRPDRAMSPLGGLRSQAAWRGSR